MCTECRQDILILEKLKKEECGFSPKSEYNKHLFDLYLKYIKRFPLRFNHFRQAVYFKQMLEEQDQSIFRSWIDVYRQSEYYKKKYGKPLNSGCPFIKTEHMLAELGVLPHKQFELGKSIEKIFNEIPEASRIKMESFLCYFKSTRPSQKTLTKCCGY